MALSQQEKQIVEFGKANGKTKEQTLAALAKFRQSQAPQPERPQSFAEDAVDDIKGIGTGIAGQVQRGIQTARDVRQNVTQGDTSPLAGTFQTIGAGLRAGAGAIGEAVIGAGKAVLPQRAEDAIGSTVQKGAEKVMGSDPVKGLVDRYNQLDPETQRNIDATLGVAEGLGTMLGAGPAANAARQTTRAGIKATSDTIESTLQVAGNLRDKVTPKTLRTMYTTFTPETRDEAVTALTTTYKDTLVENRKSINDKLEELAEFQSFGDTKVTSDDLLRGLAEEGYIPEVDGRLAKFNSTFDDLQDRKSELLNELDPVLENIPQTTSLDGLKQIAEESLRNSPQVGAGLTRSLRELDRYFESYANKYGENLTPLQVNQIRKEMNRVTKAFKDEDLFMFDTAYAMGDATRKRLDELVPSGVVREANKEWARLNTLEETARILNNQQIDVGILGRAMGSYVSTVAASGIGLSVAGPGGLVAASIFAKVGGDALADLLRKKRFSPTLRDAIVKQIRSDDEIRAKLIKEATGENKQFLQEQLTE